MADVLTELNQVTPEWLTSVLQQKGELPSGRVVALQAQQVNASSWVAHLGVTYSADAPVQAPAHLLIKICYQPLEKMMAQRNRREIAFYRALGRDAPALPVVRCYDAVYRFGDLDQVDTFHFLLDDPSVTTHLSFPHSQVPPTLAQCEAIVETLAHAQALCWNNLEWEKRLQDEQGAESWHGECHTGAITERLLPWVAETMPRFLNDLGERISSQRRTMYETIGMRLPLLLLERQSRLPRTITQGDTHVGNFLYPRNPETHGALIIDWKRADMAIGASDLAYMTALHWFPQIRERLELPLLQRYHRDLVEQGVRGYTWPDLWEDYRLCVLKHLLEAVWGWSVGQNSAIWWHHLERITLAIQDLHCMELLTPIL